MLALLLALASSSGPVAVFQIQDLTGELSEATVDQLSAYLGTRVAEEGELPIVPSSQIKEALKSKQIDSYDACYDEACQIELGRELAAQATLQAQLMKVGTRCAVGLTIYDLRTATSKRASTAKASCDEDGYVAAIDEATRGIFKQASAPVDAPVVSATTELESTAASAWSKTRTDWVTARIGYVSTIGGAAGPMVGLEVITLRWPLIYWTVIDAGTGIEVEGGKRTFDRDASNTDHQLFYVGSNAGLQLFFDDEGRHELQAGLGPAMYAVNARRFAGSGMVSDTGGAVFALLPSIHYRVRFSEATSTPSAHASVGAGVRAMVPVFGMDESNGQPHAITAELTIGFGL